MADPVVTLDVGGTLFRTRKSTLVRGSAYFHALWEGRFSEAVPAKAPIGLDEEDLAPEAKEKEKPEKETVFLDLEPEMFKLALNKMRYPDLKYPDRAPEALRPTLEFLGIDWDVPPAPLPAPEDPPTTISYFLAKLRTRDPMEGMYNGRWYAGTFERYDQDRLRLLFHANEDNDHVFTAVYFRDCKDQIRPLAGHPNTAAILARDPDQELLRLFRRY